MNIFHELRKLKYSMLPYHFIEEVDTTNKIKNILNQFELINLSHFFVS